jgi:Na+/proline symporter
MAVIDINRNPSPRELRWFGVMLAVFVAVVGLLFWRAEATRAATIVWGAGAALTLVFAAAKATRRPIYLGWIYAAYPIGWTVSHLLLGAIYYLVVTPIGLALRLGGRDPLERTFDRSASTYWTPHDPGKDVARYFKQS